MQMIGTEPATRLGARDALLFVDVQRDFCEGGPIGIAGTDAMVSVLNDINGDGARRDLLQSAASPQDIRKRPTLANGSQRCFSWWQAYWQTNALVGDVAKSWTGGSL